MIDFVYKVVGSVLINLLVDLIISNGKMYKIVKSTTSIFMFYILVTSMFDLIKNLNF